MSNETAEQQAERIALQWRAEEHATEARTAAKVEALTSNADPESAGEGSEVAGVDDAPSEPRGDEDEEARLAALDLSEPEVAALVVTVVDIGVTKALGPHMALNDREQARVAKALVPVLKKYFPDGIGVSPEVGLAVVLLPMYAMKHASKPAPDVETKAAA